ncbi:conserved hypothetical protein [Candidatus Brocadia pituitae]|nr:conserved hypothetical protein [Candidatus Brocadia pituitae]
MAIGLPKDFKEFFTLLNANGVEYLLIGGYAVGYHGYPRATTFAEATSAFFITCDDKLLRKCNKLNVKISVVSPVDFCFKEDLR